MNDLILIKTIDFLEKNYPDLDSLRVSDAVLGIFFSGVLLSDSSAGLCATPIKEIPKAVCCPSSMREMPHPEKLIGSSVADFFEYSLSDRPMLKTLGLCVLNALSKRYIDELNPLICDSFSLIEPNDYERIVVVGALVPMIRKLINANSDFKILERDKSTLKARELKYFVPAEDYKKAVGDADLLIITGTTLLNGTLTDILESKKPGARILLTGPTAGILPEVLKEFSITDLGGVRVTDADRCFELLRLGASGYHIFETCAERFHLLL